MRRLRELATDLGGAGFLLGLAIAANEWAKLGTFRVPVTTILGTACFVWAVIGLASWFATDASIVIFRHPNANSWVSGSALLQRGLKTIGKDYVTRESRVQSRIGSYIFEKLLANASRATILTHDLSWVESPEGTPLERLARSHRLKIISCGRNDAVPSGLDRLKSLGAEIVEIAVDVEVRFTLVEAGGSQSLALARVGLDAHKIHRVQDPRDPVFQLARELASALERESMQKVT